MRALNVVLADKPPVGLDMTRKVPTLCRKSRRFVPFLSCLSRSDQL
jgi:hypothetical protein